MLVSGFRDMLEERFESLIARAIADLPPGFQSKMENVDNQ
jgi:predicted Zn-dependent protease with MMP-like domain